MSQPIVINIGAIPNDGTGDPLRTAFNDVNLNFANVFASGPVGSNIQIANNSISTLNTNGNLVLSPNGIGIVQSNVSIVPNLTNVRNLGSATQRWATVYGQYLNISSGTTIAGDLSVAGNLTVSGNIVEMGNIVTDSLTIQLGNTVSNSAGADGAGITVGASDNIATILYNSTDNEWNTNIGISAVGNVSAGNVLTSAQVIANGEIQSGTGFFTGGYLSVNGNTDLHDTTVTGNLIINNSGPEWSFNTDGSLSLPAGNLVGLGNVIGPGNISYPFGPGPVLLADNSANNGAYFSLTAVANATGVLGYMGMAQFGSNSSTGLVETVDDTGVTHDWYFNSDGTTAFPNYTFPVDDGANTQVLTTDGSGTLSWSNVASGGGAAGNAGDIQINVAGNIGADSTLRYVDNGGEMTLYADYLNAPGIFTSDIYAGDGTPSNITLTTSYGNAAWTFGADGSFTPPTQPSNQRTGSGLTLKIGDTNTQTIITGPAPVANVFDTAPRLVVAGQDGLNAGEGGDIYLWAGRSGPNGGSGGDIKVDGGDGYNGSEGGTVKIRGGYSYDSGNGQGYGGFVEIYAGGGGYGAPVDIRSGQGNSAANSANITLGTPYGGTWTFDNYGNLTTPANGTIRPLTNDLTLDASGGNVYVKSKGHTFLFDANGVGRFVMPNNGKIAADSNLSINVGDWANSSGSLWTFDNTGNLTLPAGSTINNANGDVIVNTINPNISVNAILNASYGLSAGTYINQPTTALTGTGTGMTVDYTVLVGNDGIDSVSINTPGLGYANGDQITIPVGIPVSGAIFDIAVGSPSTETWTFGQTGELTTPQGGRLGSAGKGWTGLDGGYGNPVSLTSFYANGFYSGCYTSGTDGNVSISTYTGNGLQGNWTFDNGANLVLAPTNQELNGAGSGESAKLRGTRKIVNGYTNTYAYSTVLAAGGTPTVAYTATDNSVMSAKVTFAVEGANGVWEQFDVSAVIDNTGNNVNFTVSNRVKRDTAIPDTVVTAAVDGSDRITISLDLDASQTGGGWSSFDAVEFGLMVG